MVRRLLDFLYSPGKVFIFCFLFAFTSLLLNGTLIRIYRLHRDHQIMSEQIIVSRARIRELEKQIQMAKDPAYIERVATDLYDLAGPNDLLFVFGNE